jgi:hypothetical protein
MTDNINPAMAALADKISAALGVPWRWVALTGGVPCVDMKLRAERYSEAKAYLTGLLGEPETKAPWHPDHTKGVPPLRFTVAGAGEAPDHVNLIAMMQRRDKRYVTISYC